MKLTQYFIYSSFVELVVRRFLFVIESIYASFSRVRKEVY